ncbi:sensor histidine kinase [Allorhodopirellula solitaria]|uniref:histidine kinase n=1 Tax=Allorhodopirellula solitaria TaxID=2527987 RepID=A0A5C5XQF6_9BACT|nr:HAMP domain-containing sensor histidine kinase [Allorhodopirellula solitaria]TWT65140.1 Sensor protein SrrB [Allorhodopirellula solitaria]
MPTPPKPTSEPLAAGEPKSSTRAKAKNQPLTRPITLRAPVTLGVVLIVLVVILLAVWVTGNLFGILREKESPLLFWVMLLAGSVLLIAVLAGVIAYLTLSVKAFNLNRRQSNFIDAVTHELKSPIASLKLYLQTMTRRTVGADQQAEFHKIMLDDVERLDLLIDHLLEAARMERGAASEDAIEVDLPKLLTELSTAACVRYKQPPDTVEIDCQDIVLTAPPIQVEILFRNLLDNAFKYGGIPPRVHVIGRMNADQSGDVTVSVCDNGRGIPTQLRRKVFGRFIRLGNELERSKPGTGLGLYLVRNVTQAMGGRIEIVDSKNPTGGNVTLDPADRPIGTRFDVTLPDAVLRPESARECTSNPAST